MKLLDSCKKFVQSSGKKPSDKGSPRARYQRTAPTDAQSVKCNEPSTLETPAQGSLEGQDSPLKDGVLDVPQGRDSHDPDVVADKDSRISGILWMHAYEALKIRDPDLVRAYEGCLASPEGPQASGVHHFLSPEIIATIVKKNLEDREEQQLVFRLGKELIKVREQGEKVIKFILWSNTFVSGALSAQPYASLAWSGVSILLPLLLNSSQQSKAMIEGLDSICDLLRLYRIKESIYIQDRDESAHPNCLKAVEKLYTDIFEYQARLICYLSNSRIKRGVRGTFQLDDWKGMLETVKNSDRACDEYFRVFNEDKTFQFYQRKLSQGEDLMKTQTRILEMYEASQASIQRDRQDGLEAKLLETLASDYKSDKDSISTRIANTCEWVFEEEAFLEWRDSNSSRLLWISAGPGCGKSVLSRALIDERRVCTNAMTSTVCYFFFKDGQEKRTACTNALCTVLHQLFRDKVPLINHALPTYRDFGSQLQTAFSELWEILLKAAKDSEAGEIICILDALDECEEKARNQLMEKLVVFFSQKEALQSSSFKLKFLITSRPYDDIEQRFQTLSTVSTYSRIDGDRKSQRIGDEINLVIDARIPEITSEFSEQDRESISNRLKQMNNRTYLWLFLTFDIITSSRSNYSKLSSIESLLSNLPSKISDAYERILARSSNIDYARILLQLIVAAKRPLTLEEANVALTVATQKTCTSFRELDLWPQASFISTVKNICGLFVSVHDQKLSLIHQTARDYILQASMSSPSTHLWPRCFDLGTAHSAFSQVCLKYLNFDDLSNARRGRPSQDKIPEEKKQHLRLFDYAIFNWPDHYVSQGDELAKEARGAAQRLCKGLLQPLPIITPGPTRYLDWASLMIACRFGLVYVVEDFLMEGADVNAKYEYSETALHMAASKGHDQVVQLLLKNGADVNTLDHCHESALHVASRRGFETTVQRLLEDGADIEASTEFEGTALCQSTTSGHTAVVRLLLEKGADVRASTYEGTALHIAAKDGYEEIVRLLLEHGADIDANSRTRGTALCQSARTGYTAVVRLLLEKGADVGASSSEGTALHLAAQNGHEEIVRLLLEHGADIEACTPYGVTALWQAARDGYIAVVSLLLKRGADIEASIDNKTVLSLAAGGGHEDIMRLLLENGADIEAFTGMALRQAVRNGHIAAVRLLLEKGANAHSQVDPNSRVTALHLAARGGYEDIVRLLLEKDADIEAEARNGRTAIDWAAKFGREKVVRLLLENGARPPRPILD